MQLIEQLQNISKRTLANRRNALRSTGPKSENGKKRVSMNAFKHGLSGQKLFLQADEYVPYFELASEYIGEFAPVGVREEQLTQHIIDSNWRLNRCAAMENNLLSTGTLEQDNDALNAGDDDDNVAMMSQALAWQTGAKAFEALSRHETRIFRMMQKMEEELEQLQTKRLRLTDGRNTFVLEESRAWQFYNDSLAHHLSLRDKERDAEEAAAAQLEETAATCEVALICEPAAVSPLQPCFVPSEMCDYVADNSPDAAFGPLDGLSEGEI